MKKYSVVQEFFKLSEQKHYNVGDTIELTKEDEFEAMFDYLIEVKEKVTNKNK
jgi:hypothetical protein